MERFDKNKYFRSLERSKVIGDSCKEVKGKFNVRSQALEILKYDGFNVKHRGTQYLASLITLYFHERKLYQRLGDRKSYKNYWDLSDWDNEHYGMLGNTKEGVIYSIFSAISKNEIEDGPIDEIVYEYADSIAREYDVEKLMEQDEEFCNYMKIKERNIR